MARLRSFEEEVAIGVQLTLKSRAVRPKCRVPSHADPPAGSFATIRRSRSVTIRVGDSPSSGGVPPLRSTSRQGRVHRTVLVPDSDSTHALQSVRGLVAAQATRIVSAFAHWFSAWS